MTRTAPLPKTVSARLRANTHPGLMLDKYVPCYDDGKIDWQKDVQKPAIEAVARASEAMSRSHEFATWRDRYQRTLNDLRAASITCETSGPMTLHLARASALENAGICLHPLYGFAYLPGTGLKGMAHAFATEVWLPAQRDREDAWGRVCRVFGWGPSPWFRKLADRLEVTVPRDSHAGEVAFYDAWPTGWPRLEMDIVNNHHSAYYQAADGDNDHPPGDWENPIPVYFLSVTAGTRFRFAVGKRHAGVSDHDVASARSWLLGALCHLGAGAKTAAGYGGFRPVQEKTPALASPRWSTFQTTVELVTPAFLAGAKQDDPENCDLRPATLRGLLRWWWRTMHAGFVDVATLRRMEAALWGDTNQGGAVRIQVSTNRRIGPIEYNYKDRFDPTREFKARHGLADRPNNKTTQGLFYISYGMDEKSRGEYHRRYYLEAHSQWSLTLTAQAAPFSHCPPAAIRATRRNRAAEIPAATVLEQAQAALWLLCAYGGVGSKTRKGFGSLQLTGEATGDWSLDRCRFVAAGLRDALGLDNQFRETLAETASIGPPRSGWCSTIEVAIASADPWQVLDHVGFAYQAVAQSFAHNRAKTALGLPRKIHGPRTARRGGAFAHQRKTWREPEWLDFPKRPRSLAVKDARHASPVWISVGTGPQGHAVRVITFPAKHLPDLTASQTFLSAFLDQFRKALQRPLAGATPQAPHGSGPAAADGTPATAFGTAKSSPASATGKRPHGTPVTVKIIAARPKGGFDVQEAGKPQGTLTLGQPPTPPPEIGSEVTAYVHNDDPKRPQYHWDKPQPKTRKTPGGKRRRR